MSLQIIGPKLLLALGALDLLLGGFTMVFLLAVLATIAGAYCPPIAFVFFMHIRPGYPKISGAYQAMLGLT